MLARSDSVPGVCSCGLSLAMLPVALRDVNPSVAAGEFSAMTSNLGSGSALGVIAVEVLGLSGDSMCGADITTLGSGVGGTDW